MLNGTWAAFQGVAVPQLPPSHRLLFPPLANGAYESSATKSTHANLYGQAVSMLRLASCTPPPPCSPSYHAPLFCLILFEVKWSKRRTKQANRKILSASLFLGRMGSFFVTACCMQPGGATVWQTLCGGYWQPKQTVNFHFINAHLSLHFPFRYLFIYFHICATWKGLRDLHIFHFPFLISRSPFAFPLQLQLQLQPPLNFRFLFSGSKNQMQSKLFIVCLRNMKKKCQNFFCIAAAVAQLKVHVCVRVWHVACSELDLHMCRANTCPVQRRFSISTCRSSRRRATRIEKETTRTWDKKKTIVLSARLRNTLSSKWDTLAVDNPRHSYFTQGALHSTGCSVLPSLTGSQA